MEIRKMQINPEDETRLRELLKIHEADIDSLSDEQLDAAEKQTEQRLQSLLKKQRKTVLRLRRPMRTGTMAFLAAAAVMLFVQMQNETAPQFGNMITKGNAELTDIFCDITVVGAAVTSDPEHTHYEVAADTSSFLKMHCSEPVYVHLGFVVQGTLHLELRNLEISKDRHVLTQDGQLLNLTDLVAQKSGLKVLVTPKPLTEQELSETERDGLWLEDISLNVQR